MNCCKKVLISGCMLVISWGVSRGNDSYRLMGEEASNERARFSSAIADEYITKRLKDFSAPSSLKENRQSMDKIALVWADPRELPFPAGWQEYIKSRLGLVAKDSLKIVEAKASTRGGKSLYCIYKDVFINPPA